jgi:predicted DNA-binding transcriptional regulator AlpA
VAETGDFVSIFRFAEMFGVSARTVKRWIDQYEVFKGGVLRQNQTVFITRRAVDGWEKFFGRSADLITISEAAGILGISMTSLRRRAKCDPGFPKRRRVGGIVRLSRSEVEGYKERTRVDDE